MEAVILTSEQYNELVVKLDQLNATIEYNKKNPQEPFLDNQEFIQLMNISKRTAQTWRNDGVISFSQIGSKIYYKMKDVEVLLDEHYYKGTKTNINS